MSRRTGTPLPSPIAACISRAILAVETRKEGEATTKRASSQQVLQQITQKAAEAKPKTIMGDAIKTVTLTGITDAVWPKSSLLLKLEAATPGTLFYLLSP